MQEKLLSAAREALDEIAKTMLFLEIAPGKGSDAPGSGDVAISAVVGLGGGLRGSLRLAAGETTAIKLASALMGEPLSELDYDVEDGFAEIANMIAGGAQTRLEAELGEINMTPPIVVTGAGHQAHGDSKEKCVCQEFVVDGLPFFAEIFYLPAG